jgi:hypothetical protein
VAKHIEAVPIDSSVKIRKHRREQFRVVQIGTALPYKVQILLGSPLLFVPIVQTPNHQTLEAQLGQKRRVFSAVPKRVDLPAHFRPSAVPKSIIQKPKTPSELVDGRVVVRSRFVVHRPSPVGDFQLAVVDQLDHLLLEGVFLVLPPFPKKRGFDLDVASVGVAYQGFNRRAYYVLDSSVLDVFLRWKKNCRKEE